MSISHPAMSDDSKTQRETICDLEKAEHHKGQVIIGKWKYHILQILIRVLLSSLLHLTNCFGVDGISRAR